ncbi:recombination mediator RecR [Natranaerobius thermophilus]|uniref:Recombination protein RecR n=1 Tax=Natranaerobius thermophilus (strain ATCC BAA-1301 / DSM 18059 / JW/NM-WN-LF) TaxID=457570 RepID=RECR_NATTJ|nr:recombination mediator RecR [Natranaerobius thermophilus]B2A302.1 RecName: Full=Recombination protein RecR [Natranaerobius thermophilus JW/NM-WN-LF]ACB83616.1 DNA replication and repair protein RecR [Natranaerobius thermophilus JW/NM-WN-LF]
MSNYPKPINRLIEALSYLPGIGPKTAERLAFHIVSMDETKVNHLITALQDSRDKVFECSTCNNLTDKDPCTICQDESRDSNLICVVQDARDVTAIEKVQDFQGKYHVLQGVISPMEGIGPDDLNLKALMDRIQGEGITELVVATDPTVEGEATAMYLNKLVKPLGVRVTRLAYGLPMGGDLEYADEMTLQQAFEGRKEL